MDKFGCNNSLVNSVKVPVIQNSVPFLIAHLCASKAQCPLPLFIAHCKKDGGENHIIVRSWQYYSNRGFFHEQYIMNSLKSIKALCLLTYKLRKCSHSAFVSLDLSHRLMNSLQAQPSSYYKTSHLGDKNPLSLTPDQSVVVECYIQKFTV